MRVLAIARSLPENKLIPAFQAAIDGGILHLEITMNTARALNQIEEAADSFPNVSIGAGTVLSVEDARNAINAGAGFLVCPHTDPDIISFAKEKDIPVYPGALTPTEVYQAWSSGAEMVKVFPVSAMGGPKYIKDLLGPFENLQLLACGGVRPENLEEFRKSGASGIALGGSLFQGQWLEDENWKAVTEYARIFTK